MSVQSELLTRLKTSTDITDLVSNRIYPLTAPQNVAYPYITYQVINEPESQCISGNTNMQDIRIQIDCYSNRYLQTIALKDAIKAVIRGWYSSYNISSGDGYTEGSDLYRQIIDFTIKFH